MLIEQNYNSLQEIEEEFQDAIVDLFLVTGRNWRSLTGFEASLAPETRLQYSLYFAPKKNSPVGIVQAILNPIDVKKFMPWYKKTASLFSKEKTELHVEINLFKTGLTPASFLPQFQREGRGQFYKFYQNIMKRPEVSMISISLPSDYPEMKPEWSEIHSNKTEVQFMLGTYEKKEGQSFPEYLHSLGEVTHDHLKKCWAKLFKNKIELGHYPEQKDWERFSSHISPTLFNLPYKKGVLTFEKDQVARGLIYYWYKDQDLCVEIIPISDEHLLTDEVYTQYALMHLYDSNQTRLTFCQQENSLFVEPDDVDFYLSQKIPVKELKTYSYSRNPYVPCS